MSLLPVGNNLPSVAATPSLPRTAVGDTPNSAGADSFSKMIESLVDKINQPHIEADAALQDLVQGKTDDIHDVVMSVVKADMSFRLVLELRNRLTEAYQEIMRMQV